jgi:hypothetical protein
MDCVSAHSMQDTSVQLFHATTHCWSPEIVSAAGFVATCFKQRQQWASGAHTTLGLHAFCRAYSPLILLLLLLLLLLHPLQV